MSNWLLFALLAPAVYAAVNFIDKYLLSKEIKDYRALPIYTALFGFLAGLIFFAATGFPILHLKDTLIVLLTGILTSFSLIAYAKALSKEETSKIIILFQMFPVVALLLSYIFLKEEITLKQLIGFIIIFTVTIIDDLKKIQKLKISSAFFLILLYDVLWAISAILIKYTTHVNTFAKIISYESFGVGIGGLIIYAFFTDIRKAFHRNLSKIRIKSLAIVALNETFFILAKSLTFFAVSMGPVALVSILENTQVLFGVFFGWILTILFPSFVKENISRKKLIKKIFFTLIVFIGLWFVK